MTKTSSNDATAESFRVKDLPGLNPEDFTSPQYAGYIEVDTVHHGNIFYWLFNHPSKSDTAPLIIWLNGGPGCSSMDGLFLENGPFKLSSNAQTITVNPHSWHKVANLLFVDQPVGTGLSYVKDHHGYASSGKAAAQEFNTFLQAFLSRHSSFINSSTGASREIYVFGESYAGRYIPQIVDYELNRTSTSNSIPITWGGIGIGNGWVHPALQYDYSDFSHGFGFITYGQVATLKAAHKTCTSLLDKGTYYSSKCIHNMDAILDSVKNVHGHRLNYYDVRSFIDSPSKHYPPGRRVVEKYLNQPSVRSAINAVSPSRHQYAECSNPVYNALSSLDGVSTLPEVERILSRNVKTLFYNGQFDMMCNHVSTEQLLLKLTWEGAAAYQAARRYTWTATGVNDPLGFVTAGGGLTFVIVANSGHMVPMDAPKSGYELVRRFVDGEGYEVQKSGIVTTAVNYTAAMGNIHSSSSSSCPATTGNYTEDAVYLPTSSWLWICFVLTVSSIVLSSLVTISCCGNSSSGSSNIGRRRRRQHEIIVEMEDESDDEYDQSNAELIRNDRRDESDSV